MENTNTKMFEVRDRDTIMVLIANKLSPNNEAEDFLVRRLGFIDPPILITYFEQNKTTFNPYSWDNRTLVEAHKYIQNNFDSLLSGEVIDIEYILGETSEKKTSKRQ